MNPHPGMITHEPNFNYNRLFFYIFKAPDTVCIWSQLLFKIDNNEISLDDLSISVNEEVIIE